MKIRSLQLAAMSIKFEMVLPFLVCIFVFLFPKGGIKLAGVPVTWSYIFLGVAAIISVIYYGFTDKFKLPHRRMLLILLAVPFVSLVIYGAIYNHIFAFSHFAGLIVSVVVLPIICILFLGQYLDTSKNLLSTLEVFRWSVFAAAIYGIVLFVQYIVTRQTFEVPLLTTNLGDLGDIDQKHNIRGGVMKLISTYNNGNIYGVATLIIFPLYRILEKSEIRISVVRLALILTLSRTVWIGLVISEILYLIVQRRLNLSRMLFVLGLFGFGSIFLAFLISYLGKDLVWLFDASLGGREKQFVVFERVTLTPWRMFTGFGEMVYLQILSLYGLIGLIVFAIFLGSPFLAPIFVKPNKYQTACLCGCFTYCILAAIDGAFVLIPVMAFYWLITSLAFSNNELLSRD